MKIGLIGVGEVGSAYAHALAREDIALCDRAAGGRPADTAAALGLALHPTPGPWLASCEVVIAAVAGSDSPGAALSALPHMAEGAVYLDVGTASPDDLRASAAAFSGARQEFVDGAIMGAIAISGAACPVTLAGPKAEAVVPVFETLGAQATVLPESAAGDASSLKLLRSVIIKGLECVAIESLTAAEHLGVRDRLMEVMTDVDTAGFGPFIEALVRTHIPHAERRGHEMEDAAAQLKVLGFDALVTAGTPARYRATTDKKNGAQFDDAVETDIAAALAWLSATVRSDVKENA